ncbi:prolyl 3-hydroxylase 3 [Pantherophis guttatus]|uniref:procollagen-proline 3-dioxygenase n=1 Tax=Pantherophis guttatus TaxID=94885 RepID=A0A6P9B6K6_PANGU|nr:prolyl 3-hydroxylase 3 [Pantherophis guttatus]
MTRTQEFQGSPAPSPTAPLQDFPATGGSGVPYLSFLLWVSAFFFPSSRPPFHPSQAEERKAAEASLSLSLSLSLRPPPSFQLRLQLSFWRSFPRIPLPGVGSAMLPFSLLFLLLLAGSCGCFSSGSSQVAPFDLLYADGVRAYFAQDWPRASELLQRSLHSYSQLQEARRKCRGGCQREAFFGSQSPFHSWETTFFDRVLQRAECLEECLGRRLGGQPSRYRTSHAIQQDFEEREPYNYLQIAFFKLKKLDEAVSSAHTFFIANPQHLQMREDMEKYQRMAGIKSESFRDLEAEPHWVAYEAGMHHYGTDDYQQAAAKLEESLREGLLALENCRALCEGPREDEDDKEETQLGLYESIAAHYVQVLKCRQECVLDIATKPGRVSSTEDFIPSHFDLLQFAYDRVGNRTVAAECAATFLLFYPSDEKMLERLKEYQADLGKEIAIPARENIRCYVQRSLMEKKLIYYAVQHLDETFKDPDLWTPEELIPESMKEKHKEDQEKRSLKASYMQQRDQNEPLPFEDINITMDSHQLNGTQRVVFDRVLTESECKDILRLSMAAGGTGDGYRGRRSPHTPHERFEGLTVTKALQLAEESSMNWKDIKLLLQASEKSRKIVESYFTPGKNLYFSFTHLVCRTAAEGEQEGRMDLSHPVHADNCLLDPEGNTCWREPPAYIHRDYSAILYLNEDFQGGNLFFTEMDAVTLTAQVRPKCGRLVAFSSGEDNPHGVWAVTRGRRCAIALWYTLSQEHAEQERGQAEKLMRQKEAEQEQSHEDDTKDSSFVPKSGDSPEPPTPKGRARSTSRNIKLDSKSGVKSRRLRVRDEF